MKNIRKVTEKNIKFSRSVLFRKTLLKKVTLSDAIRAQQSKGENIPLFNLEHVYGAQESRTLH